MNSATFQKTITQKISLSGTTLFSGDETTIQLQPAAENSGIRFIRGDLHDQPEIFATFKNIFSADLGFRCTALGEAQPLVYPVEHLLAACYGLGVTNLKIILHGPELPFFDGSARAFVSALQEAGIVSQVSKFPTLALKKELEVSSNGETLRLLPDDRLRIDYHLQYDHPSLRVQDFSFEFSSEKFAEEIAPARTFCTEEEGEAFLKRGGKGGSLQNCLVFGRDGPLGNSLRFPEEPARHKILDLLGDLALLGYNLQAKIIANRSGHRLNALLLHKLSEGN